MQTNTCPRRSAAAAHRSARWLGQATVLAVSAALLSGCVVAPRGGPQGGRPYGGADGGGPYRAPRAEARPVAPPQQAQTTVFYYPERGQNEAQQERDRYTCYRWAVRESGTDPGMTPVREWRQAEAAPEPREGRGPLVGAVAGAAIGAAVSSPRRAAEHAVLGALFGAVLGAAAEAEQQRAARNQPAAGAWVPAPDPATARFHRAMSACMQGKGYRIG